MGCPNLLIAYADKFHIMEARVRTFAVIGFYEPCVKRLSPLASVGRVVGNDLALHVGNAFEKKYRVFAETYKENCLSTNIYIYTFVSFLKHAACFRFIESIHKIQIRFYVNLIVSNLKILLYFDP